MVAAPCSNIPPRRGCGAVLFIQQRMDLFKTSLKTMFAAGSPHMRRLGYEIIDLGDGTAFAKVRYSEDMVGDPNSGVLHGGVVTSLLDSTGGAAVLMQVRKPMPIATLDLRVDYMRPSAPGKDVYARVECYRATRNVAFVRGVAFDDDEQDPVAAMAATYMLRTMAVRTGSKGEGQS